MEAFIVLREGRCPLPKASRGEQDWNRGMKEGISQQLQTKITYKIYHDVYLFCQNPHKKHVLGLDYFFRKLKKKQKDIIG